MKPKLTKLLKNPGFYIASSTVIICILALTIILINFFGPQKLGKGSIDGVKIDYGKSYIYSKKDMSRAIDVILQRFEQDYEGCTLYNIRYDSDKSNNEETLKWLKELAAAQNIDVELTECIKFYSDFHTSDKLGKDSTFEKNKDYKNWQWYLASGEGTQWYLLSWGYG